MAMAIVTCEWFAIAVKVPAALLEAAPDSPLQEPIVPALLAREVNVIGDEPTVGSLPAEATEESVDIAIIVAADGMVRDPEVTALPPVPGADWKLPKAERKAPVAGACTSYTTMNAADPPVVPVMV